MIINGINKHSPSAQISTRGWLNKDQIHKLFSSLTSTKRPYAHELILTKNTSTESKMQQKPRDNLHGLNLYTRILRKSRTKVLETKYQEISEDPLSQIGFNIL